MNRLVQFRMGKLGIRAAEKLKQKLGFSSRAAIFRLALNLLYWVVHCIIEDGYEITAVKNKGKVERIRIPFLELRNLTQKNSQGKLTKKKKKSRC